MKTLSRALFLVLWSSLPLSAAVFPASPADWLRANGGAQAAQSATQTALRGTALAANRKTNGVAGQGAAGSARPDWLFASAVLGAPQAGSIAELTPAPEPAQWLIDLGPELGQILEMIDLSISFSGSGAAQAELALVDETANISGSTSANSSGRGTGNSSGGSGSGSAPLAPVPLPPSAALLLLGLAALGLLRRAKPLHLSQQRGILPA